MSSPETSPPTDTESPSETRPLPEGWTNAPLPPEKWADTYTKPKHGWTCYFCGETFTTPGAARYHFGADPLGDPACRIKAGEEKGLVVALRKAQVELARYRAEDTDADRAMAALEARHSAELRQAEESGYIAGLKDAERREQLTNLRQATGTTSQPATSAAPDPRTDASDQD